MNSRKILICAVSAVVMIVLAVVVYYSSEVYSARRFTIDTILPGEEAAHYPLEPSSLTSRQMEILLKVEDPCFFEHGGVDFSTPGAGITTITQGLVKRLYFDKFKPGLAKIKQTLIAAYVLDPLMSKKDQLRLFINTVYLGPRTNGFEQAANAYFRKSFAQLTEDEYIAIVAMVIAPETFDIGKFPDRNSERVKRIKRLVSGEYKPRGLFDLYYGPLDAETQKNLPPLSYFKCYYE
jgi:membrane peptidoglycan carboxypeptidase